MTSTLPASLADWARVGGGTSPTQLAFIASALPQVIAQNYTPLTKDGAYEAMLRTLTVRPQSTGRLDRSPTRLQRSPLLLVPLPRKLH